MCLDLVDGHGRVDGICRSIVHTLASLGARRRCLCAMPRDCSLLSLFVSFEQVLCFPLQSSVPPWPDDRPLNAENAGCIPSPVNPLRLSRAHLGWLARKLFGARPIPPCALAERSTQRSPSACLLPPCWGWQRRLRRRGNMPRPCQAMLTLNALPENQLLATRFCTVLGGLFLCNSSGLKLGVGHAPWPSCPLRHGDADLECGE